MTAVLGDFNPKCTNWSKADITYLEGSIIDYIASSYGLNQLIQETVVFLHWPNCDFATKFSYGIWNTVTAAFKLPPSDNFFKILFVYFLSSILQKNYVILCKKEILHVWDRMAMVCCPVDKKVNFLNKMLLSKIQNFIPHEILFVMIEICLG